MKKLLAYILASAALTASAQDPFSAIETQIAENNPEVAAARQSYEALRLSDAADNNLSDPEVEFEHLWGPKGDTRWSAGISQSFDWPGAYGARSRANAAKADARSAMLLSQMADIRYKARCVMLDIVGVNSQLALADSMICNLSRLEERTRLAMDRGQATRLDLSKVQFALLSLKQDRDEALARLNVSRSELVAINGGKAVDISGLQSYPQATLLDENTYLEAFDNSAPGLAAMQSEVVAARAEASAAAKSALPSFSVGYRHAYEDATHFDGFAVGMSLPFFSSRNRSKAAKAEVLAKALDSDSYRISSHAAIIADASNARRLKCRLSAFEQTFEATDYTSILNRLYENGQISVIDYITEINYYLDIRRQYLKLQNDYQLTLAALNRYL